MTFISKEDEARVRARIATSQWSDDDKRAWLKIISALNALDKFKAEGMAAYDCALTERKKALQEQIRLLALHAVIATFVLITVLFT